MEKRRIRIEVDGEEYTLVTNESDAYAKEVATRVDNKVRKIKTIYPQLTHNRAVVLSAIVFADEYMKLEDTMNNLRKEVAEYAKNEKLFSSLINERNKKIAELEEQVKALKK